MKTLAISIATIALASTAAAQINNVDVSERSARTLAIAFDAPEAGSSCYVRLGHANQPGIVYSEFQAWGPQDAPESLEKRTIIGVPSTLWAEPKSVEIECATYNGIATAQTWVPAPPTVSVNLNGTHDGETVTVTGGIMVQGQGAESYCWEQDFPVLPENKFLSNTFNSQETFWDTYYSVNAELSDLYHHYALANFACSGKGGVTESIVEMRMLPGGKVEFFVSPYTYR